MAKVDCQFFSTLECPNRSGTPATIKVEASVVETEVDLIDSEEEEDDDEENGISNPEVSLVRRQIKYLARLSADVVLKANKMVVVTIQKSPSLWSLPPSLRSLLYNLVSARQLFYHFFKILPSVQHTDLAIRNQAILALGLCCTLDLTLSKSYLSLFYEVCL